MNAAQRSSAWLAAALLGAAAAPAHAQDSGRQKAQLCMVCHGSNGISNAPDAPHLAGQPTMYLVAQLKAYRSGARRHEVMSTIAKGMSDEDMAAVSAWFSAIRIEARVPE